MQGCIGAKSVLFERKESTFTVQNYANFLEMYIIFGLSSNVATFATSITSKILSFNSSSNN